MKSRGIQRSVRAQRYERAAGDAPSIGRVARMPGTGLPKGVRRRRKRGEGDRGDPAMDSRRKALTIWSVALAMGVLVVLGTAVWLWLRPNIGRAELTAREIAAAPIVEKRVVSRFESPSQDEALGLVKRALALRDAAGVGEFFHPGSASPEAVVEFLRNMATVDGAVTGLDWLSSMDANGLLIDGVAVGTLIGNKVGNRLALLTPDDKGKWKIDFDAFARTVRPSWSDLLDKRAEQGLVRVIVAKDSYYNGPYRDESQWECYGMVSPDTEVILLGYCRKGSAQAAAMARIVADEEDSSGSRALNRATLEIRRGKGAESRQFEIARVLAEDWVVSAMPLDENWK